MPASPARRTGRRLLLRSLVTVGVVAAAIVPAGPAAATGRHSLIAYTWLKQTADPSGGVTTTPYIYTVDPTTGHRTKIVKGSTPAWSPTGRRLAYISPNNKIVIRNGPGSFTFTGVTATGIIANQTTAASLDWSPDGKDLVYSKDLQLWVMNTTAPYRPHQLTHCDLTVTTCILGYWSPDGSVIGYRAAGFLGVIHTIRPDGTGDSGPFGARSAIGPAWLPAPDNDTEFARIFDGPDGNLDLIAPNGHGEQIVTQVNELTKVAWSPDAAQLAFSNSDANGVELYVVNTDGTNRHVIAPGGIPGAFQPSWTS